MFWSAWPGRDRGSTCGYVYAVEYSSGAVKVGATRNPQQRMRQLGWAAAEFGVTLVRGWLSDADEDYLIREGDLIGYAATLGPRIATETFRVPWSRVVAAAQARQRTYIPTPRAANSPTAMRRAERREHVRRLHGEGRSYREIAGELGVSLGTVHADLNR
jgi:DNA-binding CsgD family transcriptional regulator